jgi:hypothetical protein
VDHPVLSLRLEQDVLAAQALSVEGHHHFVLAELVRFVGPLVPDLNLSGAVFALRDLPGEVDVLDRVILDVNGEVISLGVVRDPLRDRPRDEHAVALQSQVPMETARVMLVHDITRLSGCALGRCALGLRRSLEITLLLVLA